MSTKTAKYPATAIAAIALAMAALVGASAPAFAWGGGGPIDSYDRETVRGSGYYDYAPGYNDYAPGVVTNQTHKKGHVAR